MPDSRSSSSEYPKNPLAIDSSNRVTPTAQLSSRGRRKAPVKKTRQRWMTREATNTRAVQWCIWRITSPDRTPRLMSRVEA